MKQSYIDNQNIRAKLVLNAKATLGEGAIWHPTEKKLYWVDIQAAELHIYDSATGKDRQFSTGEKPGTVVPIEGGGVLLATQNSIRTMDTSTGELSLVVQPLHNPQVRFNDGKADPAGRFWVGTMAYDIKKGAGALYRMDKDKRFEEVVSNVTISNGLVWSSDKKTMYYIDTPTLNVQAFDYDDKTGDISNNRVVVRVPEALGGSPDGMAIDANGKLWVALHGAAAVICCDPATGEILQRVEVPAPQVTSVAFGGENLDVLYITTALEGLTPEQLESYPQSGGLFSANPGVRGVPAEFYKGAL